MNERLPSSPQNLMLMNLNESSSSEFKSRKHPEENYQPAVVRIIPNISQLVHCVSFKSSSRYNSIVLSQENHRPRTREDRSFLFTSLPQAWFLEPAAGVRLKKEIRPDPGWSWMTSLDHLRDNGCGHVRKPSSYSCTNFQDDKSPWNLTKMLIILD